MWHSSMFRLWRRGRDLLPTWLCLLALSILLIACGDDGGNDSPEDLQQDATADVQDQMDQGDEAEEMVEDVAPDVEDPCNASYVVHFQTDDGVRLEAEFSTAGVGTPAVVLLHMSPPANDRSNWPQQVIDYFNEEDIAVLNVDRRGAGGSEGVAEEAYEGPNGVLDAKAAWSFLASHQCLFDIDRIGWAGASNGTTTVADFAALSATDDGLTPPAAIAMVSAGSYTETQTALADLMDPLQTTAVLFMYPETEAAYHDAIQETSPGTWEFLEYPNSAHGTALFEVEDMTAGDLVGFMSGSLQN